ncbi:hypothetical protein C1I97_09930 [Streptomyces sp. NTH33]|uniref:hypothetical protein n=1 Tax=Streptomyces sp. NTH33 TaxID=1735453 RepID=UPI000DA8196B|nr:hypothetical protein [Streptomyces sp. NTH33]PZH14743.1 hypothetical protein C1I97_09930 [Streptomyces sp. NTH33]
MKAKKRLLTAVPLALAMVVCANAQANAVTKHWSSRTYSDSFQRWSEPLDRCVTLMITGTMEYRWWLKQPNTGRKDMWIDQIKLKNPQLKMTVKGQCNRSGAPRNVSSVKMSQYIYDYGCHTSTAITVSVPFAVGVTPTKKCGRIKVAKATSSFPKKDHVYTQNNTGRPVTFKPKSLDAKPYPGHKEICLRADVSARVVLGNTDDSFSKALKACAKVFK